MAEKSGKRLSYEDEQQALSIVAADPRSDEAHVRLGHGLRSSRSLVVARAARLIKDHVIAGFEPELVAAFERFLQNAKKSDPSCHAKLAAIDALDHAEWPDPAPFRRAARHVQMEGADTAAPLRARGVLALARLGPPDFHLFAAELLTDPLPPVRQAALDALVHRGDGAGAPLALLKLGIGDEDPLVTLAAMTALVALAPPCGLEVLGALLDGDDEERRELAAAALGQSRRDDALTVLFDKLERCVRAQEREPILRAVGLHRSDRALERLLVIIADGAPLEAETAVTSLAARRFEPGLAARVRQAAARNDRVDLAAAIADFER